MPNSKYFFIKKSKNNKYYLTKIKSDEKSNIYKTIFNICLLVLFVLLKFSSKNKLYITFFNSKNNINKIINGSTNDITYDEEDENINPDNATIYYEEKFDSYREAYNKAKDFINNNLKGILINQEKIPLSKKPKVSAVIPCYNCGKFILSAVRSIQNQDLLNIEIIIVNDNSTDNTSLILEQLKSEDERIKIFNNQKNMGALYTRSIAVLFAKGKYIFPCDSDDMLLSKDVFSTITNISDKGNFDIIVFNSINTDFTPNVDNARISLLYFEGGHKPNNVLMQPELGYYPFQLGGKNRGVVYMEVYIFAKCIKTKIFKEALNKLGMERYSRHMVLDDDLITNYILFNTAKIIKFVPKYGYIYIERKGSSTRNENRNQVKELIYRIYVLDVVIEFSKNEKKNKEILINFLIFFFTQKELKDAINSNEYNKKLFISILDRIFKCKYISDESKNEARIFGKSLDFINYSF